MTKILIVEDNEMNRDMLSRRLKRRGYEVLVAVDGEMGIDLARTHAPDLILMDIQIPIVDGYEATRRIKADPDLQSIPIIAVTSHALYEGEQRARSAGCDESSNAADAGLR